MSSNTAPMTDGASTTGSEDHRDYVTMSIGSQMFGIPVLNVQDVLGSQQITRVPLAPPEVAGLLNSRGRIVTLIDVRRRLDLGEDGREAQPMAIGVECRGESYGLLVDSVGEVLKLDDGTYELNPVNLAPRLAEVSAGIHRLEDQLLLLIDVDRLLGLSEKAAA
jgi:purine-binding chemotaxis protein CheW